jgi:hypothetical protein
MLEFTDVRIISGTGQLTDHITSSMNETVNLIDTANIIRHKYGNFIVAHEWLVQPF